MSRMDHSIILAGQQPDFVNMLANSTRAAALANQNQHQNALRQTYQEHGPGIVAGDQNALNQLSRLDPGAAFDIQQTNRQNARQDRMDALSEQEFAFRINQFKANASAAQVKAQAEEFKQTVFSASAARTPEEWDAIVTQAGENELVGQFDNREALLRKYMTAAQILEADEPQKPQSGPGKLKADLDAGLITPEQFEAEMAADGFVLETDGKGGVTFRKGKGAGGKPPSERQSTLLLFGGLMDETMPAINAMEDDPDFNPVSVRSAAAGAGTAGNVVTTPEARKYEALKRQWAEGVLRIQTGAAATEPEIRRVLETYFPRFGDDAATIEQKRQQRDAFARSLAQGSGGTMIAPGGADARDGIGEVSASPAQEGITEVDIDGVKYRVQVVE